MMISDQAEIIRLKHKYRKLILSGQLTLPHKEAARLLGPDCAYHLYSLGDGKRPASNRSKKKSE